MERKLALAWLVLALAIGCVPDAEVKTCSADADCGREGRCSNDRCELDPRPRIESFSASRALVAHGSSTTLSWTLAGAAPMSVVLDGIPVGAETSSVVVVRARRTVTLTAANAEGTASATLELVGQGISTFAGHTTGGVGSNDGPASDARMMGAVGLAFDVAGDLFFSDHGLGTIRRLDGSGELITYAGRAGSIGDADGATADARFSYPKGVAFDARGDLFVADNGSGTIRKISGGVVTTWAGVSGELVHVDGPLADARFAQPDGLAFDSHGNLFVSESRGESIRKITPDGIVSTFAGATDGTGGLIDGAGSDARFFSPGALAIDANDVLYVADAGNHAIRTITPDGAVTTLAGGEAGYVDGDRAVARFDAPQGVAVDADGSVFVADRANHAIRKITRDGRVSTYASASTPGWQDGPREGARFFSPWGLALDRSGALWVGEVDNHTIRRIDPSGDVTTAAGRAIPVGSADATKLEATFLVPRSVTTTTASGLPMWIADTKNHTLRAIDRAGRVRTLAGAAGMRGADDGTGGFARFDEPSCVVVGPSGDLFVVDTGNRTIREVTPSGAVTTIAGKAGVTGDADGPGADARFTYPRGAAFDADGDLWIADLGCIRVLDPRGDVHTVAGRCGDTSWRDDLGTSARFVDPAALAFDPKRNLLYVADATTVRALGVGSRAVETIAGQPSRIGYFDGPADTAFFGMITGLAYDAAADVVWVADQRAIRRLTPPAGEGGWQVDTVAGTNLGWIAAEEGPLPGHLGEVYGVTLAGEDLFVPTPHGVLRLTAPSAVLR